MTVMPANASVRQTPAGVNLTFIFTPPHAGSAGISAAMRNFVHLRMIRQVPELTKKIALIPEAWPSASAYSQSGP